MKFHRKVLKNGMRVITVPMKDTENVTVMVLVEAGSEYENKKNNGISHFLEHMCFKGTLKRPTAKIISHELDSIGAESNAFTGSEYTGYYAKAHQSHLSKLVEIVSDVYLNSTFPEKEIEKEKGVVVEEINMYEEMPQHKTERLLYELLYPDQPAGFEIAGTRENVRKFSRQDLISYRKDHYVSKATVLVIAGRVDNKILPTVEEAFSAISKGLKKGKKKTTVSQRRPQLKVHHTKGDQTHIRLAFRSFNRFDKRWSKALILGSVLGGGMSSRLFQKMREDLGLCYYISAGNRFSIDHGTFVISCGVDKGREREAVAAILEEIKKIRIDPLDEIELKKAKDYRIGRMFLGLESSDDLADYFGFQEIYKEKIITPKNWANIVKKVTAKDIQKVAQEIFQNSGMNLVMAGPVKNSRQFLPLLKVTGAR